MPLLDLRRRGSTFLFVVVTVGQIVLISASVTTKTGVSVLQAVAFGLVAEVQRAGATVAQGFSSVWGGYIDLRGLRTENTRLRDELTTVRIQLQRERALAQRSDELSRLLDLKTRTPLETAAAEVIAGSATPDFRTITIGKGSTSGIRPDMAVIAPNGVVGRIVVPSAHAAKVQLLIDRNAAAGALVERSRAQGVVLGKGDSTLKLDFVSGSADLRVGDTVVTSGIDGIYPKGFVIGRIQQIDRAGGAYRSVLVQPAVDFSNLEDVLVVLTPTLPATDGADAPEQPRAPATPRPAAPPPAQPAPTQSRPPQPTARPPATRPSTPTATPPATTPPTPPGAPQ
jgi:rod shape-determining protein MreC